MAKRIVVDKRYIEVAKEKWGAEYEILPSFCVSNIDEPVSCHTDMSIVKIGDSFVCESSSYDYYKAVLKDKNIIKGKTILFRNYPEDIAYNVLIFENVAMANFEHTDITVKNYLLEKNFKLININQGYAKCSAAVFSGGIITADNSIYKACIKNGIDVLKITPGNVNLTGYGYGFIGGASGFADGKLLFFGDITKHPDFEKIEAFLNFKRISFDYIHDFPLTDVGTIVGIDD